MRTRYISVPFVALALLLTTPSDAWARDGSLEQCGSLSAPVRDVIHHCRRALSRGGLSREQEFIANLNLGDALLNTGRAGAARDAFAAAEATGLERVELFVGRAGAEEALGDRLEAARQLDRALALAPQSLDVRLARGAFYLRIGQADAALEEFDAATRIDGSDADARFNRGLTLIALDRGAEAEADFSAVIRAYPNDSGAYFQRGRARAGRDDSGALADFARATELSPEWALPFFTSGRVLDRIGREAEANRRFRRAFELGLKDPWLLKRIHSLGG